MCFSFYLPLIGHAPDQQNVIKHKNGTKYWFRPVTGLIDLPPFFLLNTLKTHLKYIYLFRYIDTIKQNNALHEFIGDVFAHFTEY